MADEAAPIYPPPPPFWITFTEANVEHVKRLRDEATEQSDPSALSVPPELEFLVPPPEPSNGTYRAFGETRNKDPEPPALGHDAQLLHSDKPSPAELVRLTRTILLAFLEYVHILATNPHNGFWGTKWEDMRDTLANAHHALNYYRPWAAREEMIKLLENRVTTAREQIKHIEDLEKRTEEVMQGFQSAAEALGPAEGSRSHDEHEQNGVGTNGTQKKSVTLEDREEEATWAVADGIEVEE